MANDLISDEIARFVGLFHLDVEGNRLRLEYEAFSFIRDKIVRDPQSVPQTGVSAPYSLKGFDPGLTYLPPPAPPSPGTFHPEFLRHDVSINFEPPISPSEMEGDDPLAWGGWSYSWSPPVAVPNSILVSFFQKADLSDNDLLLVTGETVFVTPAQLTLQFLELIVQAEGISALATLGMTGQGLPQPADLLALMAKLAELSPAGPQAEVQLFLRGEGAVGDYVNGKLLAASGAGADNLAPVPYTGAGDPANTDAPASVLPDFTDLLPKFLAEKNAAREEAAMAAKDALATRPDGTTNAPETGFEVDPGHKVVTGANLVTNEVSVVQVWVDAPVIAVAGDTVRLDIVSQVNVMAGAASSAYGPTASPSQMLNAVSRQVESSVDPDDPTEPAAAGQLPENWTIVHVEGDLVAVNWVKQYVFATDFDRAEITVTAAATYISTSENIISNSVQLVELGFHYDLILVGGSMVSLNVIDQVNVLMDADVVGGAEAGKVSHASGDNLQYNQAELMQTGRDELTEMKASFRTALDDMAEGSKSLSSEVAQDALFAGKSALKVLYVKGDFLKANIIEQKNFLGDTDQIQLMLDDLLAFGETVELVTGSNAQLNAAKIVEIGLDSEIMVGGEAYSDALIYQAQLVESDAPPTGVNLSPLANEAVAFLADGMLAEKADHEPAPFAAGHDQSASGDALHAMLT
ncbi:hypothetical protein [Pseudotabrizicola formosa]|uniref:hypothetical protein n=1 Tax=Pseudotabrizicola formosa TaxID=2030009 RepID=UPI000CD1EE3B|nr:hypothetical protein [Pseudotabrizicola formosa]